MSIAIRVGDDTTPVQGLIYLDATVAYSRSYSGKVTKFPLASGASISDHFIAENPKFSVEGYLSGVDLSGMSSQVRIGDFTPSNANSMPEALTVQERGGELSTYLPSALSQFASEPTSVAVTGSIPGEDSLPRTDELFVQLMSGMYFNTAENKWRNQAVLCILYELEDLVLKNARVNVVMLDYKVNESPDSGDALHVTFDFEQVRYATIEKTDLPAKAAKGKKKTVAATQKKAQQDSTKKDTAETKDGVGDGPSKKLIWLGQTRESAKSFAKATKIGSEPSVPGTGLKLR